MNKLTTKVTLISFACAAILLTGCGNSSSSPVAAVEVETSGTVSGSYYEGANVCFDTLETGTCADETIISSDANGDYTLTQEEGTSYSIIAEVPVGALKHTTLGDAGVEIDASTKTTFAIPKEAIAQAKIDGGNKVVISAITTKLYTYMEDNADKSFEDAQSDVADILGIDKDDMLKDFNSPDIDAATRELLQAKTNSILSSIAGKDSLSEVSAASASYISAMTLPENIDVIKAK